MIEINIKAAVKVWFDSFSWEGPLKDAKIVRNMEAKVNDIWKWCQKLAGYQVLEKSKEGDKKGHS